MRIFVDPQNDITTEKSLSIKYCESLLSSVQWETTKVKQLRVSRAHYLFSNLPETSIDLSTTSCLPSLCKTIEKMEEGNNKIWIVSFLPSFLSVSSVKHAPSGWCFTDETVSHVETDLLFCLKSTNCLHPHKINSRKMFMPHEKQSWN